MVILGAGFVGSRLAAALESNEAARQADPALRRRVLATHRSDFSLQGALRHATVCLVPRVVCRVSGTTRCALIGPLQTGSRGPVCRPRTRSTPSWSPFPAPRSSACAQSPVACVWRVCGPRRGLRDFCSVLRSSADLPGWLVRTLRAAQGCEGAPQRVPEQGPLPPHFARTRTHTHESRERADGPSLCR